MKALLWIATVLLILGAMFLIAALIENISDGGPASLTVNSLGTLVILLVVGGLLLHLMRHTRR